MLVEKVAGPTVHTLGLRLQLRLDQFHNCFSSILGCQVPYGKSGMAMGNSRIAGGFI